MKKVLILVMSSGSLINRRKGILNSWGKLISNYPDIDIVFYSDDEDPLTNTYLLDCPFTFTYGDNEIKTLTSFKLIRDKFYNNYNWYLWVDDDTFVNIPLLHSKVDSFDKNCIIGKDITGCWGNLKYVSGGAGFLISNDYVPYFFNIKNSKSGYNDVSIGIHIKENKLRICDSNYFDPRNPYQDNNLAKTRERFKERITFHRVDPEQMLNLMNYL